MTEFLSFDFKVAQLIQESHEIALSKGWWPKEGRSWVSQTNNFFSEVAEAWEEWRVFGDDGLAKPIHHWCDPDCPDPAKPEGFWVEVADLLIRFADSMGFYKLEYFDPNDDCDLDRHETAEAFIADLFRWCNLAMNSDPTSNGIRRHQARLAFSGVAWEAFQFAEKHKVDLWGVIREKHAYNRTRSQRHGNKHA